MKTTALVLSLLAVTATLPAIAADGPPPLPAEAPVLIAGHPAISGTALGVHRASFAMGGAGKEGPLALGEKITAGAYQESVLELVESGGRSVLRRSTSITRTGSDEVLARASIDMDPETLLPLVARTEQGGNATTLEYDWDSFTVRRSPGSDGAPHDETALDLPMFEVGAHDVWMAALPLEDGFTAKLPAVFGATGTKYWAVPRVTGSEKIDLGDGAPREAWVVELDWWGMGSSNTADNHSRGGGANDTGGPGGKYWVLKETPANTPAVVRVRTEANPETDSVIQLQGGA